VRPRGAAGALAVLLSLPLPAPALDHDNLDPNRPIQMEDAYPIAEGEIAMEGGVQVNDRRQGPTIVAFRPQIIYGAFANAQLEIMSTLLTDQTTVPGPQRSGDLRLGLLYNFNAETLYLPAFAGRVEVEFPTGVNAQGVDTAVTGVLTRSFGRLRAHLNAEYTFVGAPQAGERSGFYRLVAAVSYPIGYPARFRETLILDVYARQSDQVGGPVFTGLEAGLRHQLSPRIVLDAGIGTEVAGPADRAAFLGTVGLSAAF
jgi:hypothetical protein